jgi:hypothetical protein
MCIASKRQGKKLEHEISLAQSIEPQRMMKWSDVDISFGPEDLLDIELSERNLPLVVKLPIGQHKVAKTLIDNGASLNLIMRKTFIEMGLVLSDLTPIHDMFHGVIPGQLSIPIGCIDLEVCCGIGDNKCKEILTFDVASINIRYNCILGRPILLKFMAVIQTAYAMMKMSVPKAIITIKANQYDALAYENATLTHAGRFGEKASQEQEAKVAKTSSGSTLFRSSAPKPQTIDTPRHPSAKKGIHVVSGSNQPPTNQLLDHKNKEAADKEVPVVPIDSDKKLRINTGLEAK